MRPSQPASPKLHAIHARALLAALQAEHGDIERTARALGVSREKLRALIDGDPSALWTPRTSRPSLPPFTERDSRPSHA